MTHPLLSHHCREYGISCQGAHEPLSRVPRRQVQRRAKAKSQWRSSTLSRVCVAKEAENWVALSMFSGGWLPVKSMYLKTSSSQQSRVAHCYYLATVYLCLSPRFRLSNNYYTRPHIDAITDSTSTASLRLPPHNAHLLRARCSGDTFIVCRRFSSLMSYLEDRHDTIQAGTTMLRHRDAFLYQRPSRYPVVVPFSTRQAGQEVSCRRTLSPCTSVTTSCLLKRPALQTYSQRWMRGLRGPVCGQRATGASWRFAVSWYAANEGEGSKDARAAHVS